MWQAVLESGRSADVDSVRARRTRHAAARGRDAPVRQRHRRDDHGARGRLGWTVGWSKSDFLGRDRLLEQKGHGIARKLVGFEMVDRGIARHGYPVVRGGRQVGVVTSGTQTPFLKKAIGMAYVPLSCTPGTSIDIDVRGRESRRASSRFRFTSGRRAADAVPSGGRTVAADGRSVT